MFLRCTRRKKNGKDHCYWSIVAAILILTNEGTQKGGNEGGLKISSLGPGLRRRLGVSQWQMLSETIVQGRNLSGQELAQIQALLVQHPSWHRTRLSRNLCELWGWRNEAGRISYAAHSIRDHMVPRKYAARIDKPRGWPRWKPLAWQHNSGA